MITLALIGIGEWGKNYLSTIKVFSNCRIKYVCSKTTETLQKIDGNFIKTTNYRDLFKYKDIDGVIIATSGPTHYQIAKEFLRRGFNLLIEKPLTTDYRQAIQLKELENKTHAKVLVGHIYLFDPAFIQMKKLVKQIGTLKYVSYEAINNGPFRSDMSVLWDLGPHAISLILDIYGQNPLNITAWAGNCLRPKTELFDVVNIKMEFTNQRTAFVKISWLSPIKRRELIVVGKLSTLVYSDLYSNKLTLFEGIGPQLQDIDVIKKTPKIKYPPYNRKLPLEIELSEFIKAISTNRVIHKSDLDFGVKVTRLLNLAENSIRKGGEAINVG